MLLSKPPNEGPRDVPFLQEQTMCTDHHTLLAPRKHDVRPSLVLHESRVRSSNDRNDDMIRLIALEGINIEHSVFPGETRGI